MSWLDQLQQASWRGVPFHVDSVEVRAGDNVVLREYPFADLPSVYRMGAAAETIKFAAYVIGPDYREQRDQLRQALTGEGVLVHPTAGSMRASVADLFTMTEAPLREGTVVRFDLTFVRAEVRTYPANRVQTQAVARAAAKEAKAAAVDQFGAEFSVVGAPAWVQQQVIGRLGDVTAGVWGQLKGVTSGLSGYTDSIVGSYQVLRDGLVDLVSTPAALAGAVGELFTLPDDLKSGFGASFMSAYQSVFGVGSKTSSADVETVVQPGAGQPAMFGQGASADLYVGTEARQQLERLNGAADRLVNVLALGAWVEAMASDDLAGYDSVMAQRRWLYERCTGLLQEASAGTASASMPSSNWHDAVLQLLTTAQADMVARGADRARLSAFTPKVCMSIWQLSYLLYGSADWADELMAMNPHITHPLLVPAGRAVRVVQHG